AAHRHVRHAELAGQLVHTDPAPAPDLVQNQGAPLLREEVLILAHVRSGPFASSRPTRPAHLLRQGHSPLSRCADVPSLHGWAPTTPPTRRAHVTNAPSVTRRSPGSGRFRVHGCTPPPERRSLCPHGHKKTARHGGSANSGACTGTCPD